MKVTVKRENMGVTALLWVLLVVCKLIGELAWPWFIVIFWPALVALAIGTVVGGAFAWLHKDLIKSHLKRKSA